MKSFTEGQSSGLYSISDLCELTGSQMETPSYVYHTKQTTTKLAGKNKWLQSCHKVPNSKSTLRNNAER